MVGLLGMPTSTGLEILATKLFLTIVEDTEQVIRGHLGI